MNIYDVSINGATLRRAGSRASIAVTDVMDEMLGRCLPPCELTIRVRRVKEIPAAEYEAMLKGQEALFPSDDDNQQLEPQAQE